MMSVRFLALLVIFSIIIMNSLTLAQEPTEPSEPEDLKSELNNQKDIRLDELAKILAEKAKINLVLTHEIDKKINFKLEDNVDPFKLLQIIVNAHGYELVKNGSIYTIEAKKESTTSTTTPEVTTPTTTPVDGSQGLREIVESGPSYFQLTRIPVEQVESKIRALLSVNGQLDVNREGNSIYVTDNPENVKKVKDYVDFLNVDPANAFDARTQQRVYKINHLDPNNVEDIVRKIGSEKSKYMFDRTSMTLIVSDREEVLNNITQFLNAADQAEPQLFIHCHFIEVEVSAGTTAGTKFQATDVKLFEDTTASPIGFNMSKGIDTDKNDFSTISLASAKNNIEAFFGATANRKNMRILSSPNLLCYNRQRSSINMITEVPYVQAQTSTDGDTQTTSTIEYKEVGISMEVTPEIYSDGTAKLNLKPSVSEVTEYFVPEDGSKTPIIKKKAVESNVMVKNNQVVVIGGLLEDQTRKSRNKVPLLGDIPILGLLFSYEDQTIQKTELIIFLHIILVNDNIIKNMANSKWQEQEDKFQKYDTEFEFYPHMREKLDIDQLNPNYNQTTGDMKSSAIKSRMASTTEGFEFIPHNK